MVRKGINPIEEEFKKYGASDSEFFQEERVKAGPIKKQKSGLSKVIHILVILILIVILAILGKVGYMFFSNPSTLENVVQSSAQSLQSVAQQSSTQAPPPQEPKAISKPPVVAVTQKPVSQATVETTSKVPSSSAQTQSSEPQKLQQQLAVALAQKSEPQPQKSDEVPQAKALEDMSDEELVKLLMTLKPDQLEKLDIQKIFKEKSAKRAQAPKVKVAKTEYLNNQAIVTPKKRAVKNDELSKISQELSSLLGEVETTSTETITLAPSKKEKPKSDTYLKGLQTEVKTREKTMRFYVVKEGDTLSKIAKSIYGKASAYIKIYEANQDIITNPRLIFPGQKLRIPEI